MTTVIGGQRVLRPVRHLRWRTTSAGNIALVVPGGAVAIGLAVQDGHGVLAGIIGLVTLLVAVIAVLPALLIRIRLDPDGLTTFWRWRLGATHVGSDSVARTVIRTIYNGDGISTNRHMFVLDGADHVVHRMSDRWWTDEQLLTVAHHLAVPLETQNQPVHLAEVRRTARSHLRWSERHRILAGTVLVVVGAACCFGFAWLTTIAL
jgi:hypothetical protein